VGLASAAGAGARGAGVAYRAYQGRLAERDIAGTFARCTEFLAQAASLVDGGS